MEADCRAVCEPYFSRPLSEISIAEVVVKLFRTAQRYELTLQPQLILLQKTLLNIEGVGRLLDPNLDMFAVALPVLRHRVLLNFQAEADGVDPDQVVGRLLEAVSP